jgi:hypothetical protein
MVILEGRKENVFKKYEKQILNGRKLVSDYLENGSAYDFLITDPFMVETNYKYLDDVLKFYFGFEQLRLGREITPLPPSQAFSFIQNERELLMKIVNGLKFFETHKKKFKYSQFSEYVKKAEVDVFLKEVKKLKTEDEKKKELEIKSKETTRVFENDNLIVLRPLTWEASCLYGAGTKWCSASKKSMEHFLNYSSTGGLYYFIMKGISSDNKYHKVALYKTDTGETWYDAEDNRISKEGVDSLKSRLKSDVLNLIEQDYKLVYSVNPVVMEAFNSKYSSTFQRELPNQDVIGDKEFGMSFYGPQIINDFQTSIKCDVFIEEDKKMTSLGEYILENEIEYKNKFVKILIQPEPIDSNIEIKVSEPFELTIGANHEIPRNFFNDYGIKVFNHFYNQLIREPKFIELITPKNVIVSKSPKTFAGYTLLRRDKLIGDLIKWLDEGNEGTKMDFLVSVGKLEERDGQYYPLGSNSSIIPRGYLAPFFSTAKAADIIDYKKDGSTFIITKGKNFDKYKEGAKIVFM